MNNVRCVGLDVHERSIVIAVAESDGSVMVLRTIEHDIPKLVRELKNLSSRAQLKVAYEAGATGFGLARALHKAGFECHVIAPSRVPKNGRQKTDKEDAIRIARFLRSGDLVSVYVPEPEIEAIRELTRARENALKAQQTARGQLRAFLVSEGLQYEGKTKWNKAHLDWIAALKFERSALRLVRDEYLREVFAAEARVSRITAAVETEVMASKLLPMVEALQALRGIQLVTAATIAAEVGDFTRFGKASHFMSYTGLVPREASSGERTWRGSITKAGNSHLRRVLGEAAWHYRFGLPGKAISKRREKAPSSIQAIAEKAQDRLHHRWNAMNARRKEGNKIATAIARELAGFVWAIGVELQRTSAAK